MYFFLRLPCHLRAGPPARSILMYYRTLRFSGRCFLALIAMDGMYACFAGAKTGHKKITIFRVTLNYSLKLIWQKI
jgi:hypothetical protein